MAIVETFLCCLSLEFFGLFIGWMKLVGSAFVLIVFFIATGLAVYQTNAIALFLSLSFAAVTILFVIIDRQYIRGVITRDYEKMKAFRAWSITWAFVTSTTLGFTFAFFLMDKSKDYLAHNLEQVISIFNVHHATIPSLGTLPVLMLASAWVVTDIYQVVCINSLFIKIREECKDHKKRMHKIYNTLESGTLKDRPLPQTPNSCDMKTLPK